MKSMTGFAHHAFSNRTIQGTLTLKSYNNRFLDLSIALPASAARIEPQIREFLSSRIVRGKVECTLKLKKLDLSADAIELNVPLAQQLSERLKTLADACAI